MASHWQVDYDTIQAIYRLLLQTITNQEGLEEPLQNLFRRMQQEDGFSPLPVHQNPPSLCSNCSRNLDNGSFESFENENEDTLDGRRNKKRNTERKKIVYANLFTTPWTRTHPGSCPEQKTHSRTENSWEVPREHYSS